MKLDSFSKFREKKINLVPNFWPVVCAYIYIYIYIYIYNIVSYIYKGRELNISDRAYVDLGLDSIDTVIECHWLSVYAIQTYIDLSYIYIYIYIHTQ